MKLRIKGNSLRLRVSRSELVRFQAGVRIEETIHFTPAPEAKLTYALESALQPFPVTLRYGFHEVTVILRRIRHAFGWQRTKLGCMPVWTSGQRFRSMSSSRKTSPASISTTRKMKTPSRTPLPELTAERREVMMPSRTYVN
jgi:hypothetical protein